MSLFLALSFIKEIINVICVSVHKHLTRFQNFLYISSRPYQVKDRKTSFNFQCLHVQHVAREPQVEWDSYRLFLSGRSLSIFLFKHDVVSLNFFNLFIAKCNLENKLIFFYTI